MSVVYNLTAAGNDAVFGKNEQAQFPLEYRRLLGLISSGGHIDVLRGRLRRFPDALIDDWLRELQDLEMISAQPAVTLDDFTFTGRRPPRLPPLLDDDSKELAKTAVIAGATCCARVPSSPTSA